MQQTTKRSDSSPLEIGKNKFTESLDRVSRTIIRQLTVFDRKILREVQQTHNTSVFIQT